MELGTTQDFVFRTCPGPRVFVSTGVIRLFSGDQKVEFSEHNQDRYYVLSVPYTDTISSTPTFFHAHNLFDSLAQPLLDGIRYGNT